MLNAASELATYLVSEQMSGKRHPNLKEAALIYAVEALLWERKQQRHLDGGPKPSDPLGFTPQRKR